MKEIGPFGKDLYQKTLQMIADGMTMPQIAEALNVRRASVWAFAKNHGVDVNHRVYQRLGTHEKWKGNIRSDGRGYLRQRVALDGEYGYLVHEKRNAAAGYAFEHRIVMHDKLGRRLLPTEVIDHRDGNKKNNHPDNLRVFASNAEHLAATMKGVVKRRRARRVA